MMTEQELFILGLRIATPVATSRTGRRLDLIEEDVKWKIDFAEKFVEIMKEKSLEKPKEFGFYIA